MRRAILRVSSPLYQEFIKTGFPFPDSSEVHGFRKDEWNPHVVEFLIEDPGFPEAEEGKFLPYVTAELGTGEDGKACFKKWVFL